MYNFRYPGQCYQAETGLYYNYFRDYDPQTGRYLDSDPIGPDGGSYSTYAYAGGSPFLDIDSFGLKETAPGYTFPTLPFGPGTPENATVANLLTDMANNIANTIGGGGLATTPPPHTHSDENEALAFTPDPFGGKDACARLEDMIKVLRAQIAWRRRQISIPYPATTLVMSNEFP